ncbi:hypothetical protein HMPREF9713_00498 [Myroides odoratimimus CCUG 12700]|uniref:hypothetical protein n=1 Tax=Myroides odoratimimus TaxID=76832 RepID=UPI0003533766|nr:hypothetical protein [Myroides odoratimimus]EPH13715.1 hypothetical protein HMPREF9713_00498 [Myroides odoratimimus CCUG 12700]
MIKSKFIIFITLTLSLALHAQKVEDPLPLTNKQIQKEQWVIQDKEKNLILQWTDGALEIALANKPINQDQKKTIYARIPAQQIKDNITEYVLLTDKTEFLSTPTTVNWTQEDLEFFRVLESSAITVSSTTDVLMLKKGTETKYVFYNTAFDRMCKFVSRFNWGLIALNRDSDNLPKMITSFDFENKTMTGTIDNIPFEVKFDFYFDQDTFYFKSFEIPYNAKNRASRKAKERYGRYFTDKTYRYDIAEQTLNFYQDEKLVLMFGFMPKE